MRDNRIWRSLGILHLIFIGSLFTFYSPKIQAEPARRSLELELDDVPGSTGYEVRVSRILADKSKKPPIVFKITGNKWSAKLLPGKYAMEVRSFDDRHVPGSWSAPQEFVVKLPSVELVAPGLDASLKSEDSKSEKVTFEWKPVEGAEKYKLKILNPDLTVVQESVEKGTSAKVKLPVGQQYKWNVTPVMEEDVDGEDGVNGPRVFEIIGVALDKPKLLPVDEVNTTEFNWATPQFANKYKYTLEVYEKQGEGNLSEWKPFDLKETKTSHRLFKNPIPSGKYRVTVVAQGDRRLDSEPSVVEFKTTFLNTRSPAAVEQVKSESAYETKSPIFALASYYVSLVNYQGQNNDSVAYNTSFKAVGGTGRLGIGTWFHEDSKIGVMTTADLSGFTFQNSDGSTSNPLYYCQSLQGVYRQRLGGLGQLRINFGGEYRTLPVALSDNPTSPNPPSRQSVIITIDPLIGVTLSHGFTRKLGGQVSFQVSDSVFGVTMPTSTSNVPTMSFDLSILGSLNLTPSLVGFMGIAMRDQKAQYSISSGSSATGSNVSEITGTYVNLLLEYGF